MAPANNWLQCVMRIDVGIERRTHTIGDGLRMNEALWECLHRLPTLNLSAWYPGAGCVAQTIRNLAHGKTPSADILDHDLV